MPLDSRTNEYNPVQTASATPGRMSALGYGTGTLDSGWNSPSTVDMGTTDLSSLSSGDLFGTSSGLGNTDPGFSNVGGGDLSNVGSATGIPMAGSSGQNLGPTDSQGVPYSLYAPQANPTSPQYDPNWTPPDITAGPAAATPSAQGGSWWQNLLGGLGTVGSGVGSLLTGKAGQLAGIGAVGAIGLKQAKATQAQNDARAKQLADAGGPYTAAGQALLKQFQSGQIRPDQTAVANLATSQGDTLIQSGAGLSAIAQSAYQNYQSGTLPQADELKLSQQVASQKQELRARLGNITDSSILAGYDQQIDNQAQITRQDLLDKRFATGNQAYDEWLKSTTEGQQLKMAGAEFASKSLDNMLNQSLSLSAEGMGALSQSIQLAIQSDTQLSQQVNELMGNLASAYAYTMAGGSAGGGGGGGGTGPTGRQAGGVGSSLAQVASGIGQIFGKRGASGGSAGASPGTYDPATSDFTGAPGQTSVDWTGQTTGNDAWSQGTPTWNLPGATDPNAGFTGDPGQTSVDWNQAGGSTDVPSIDTSPPSGAGGQAATQSPNMAPAANSGGFNTGAALSDVGTAAGLYQGLQKGGVAGYGTAAVDTAKLASASGAFSKNTSAELKGAGTQLGNVLGIYGGIKEGGVAGYAQAANSAYGLVSGTGGIPGVGAALSTYNFVKNYQSGDTGGDALRGAEAGASIGTLIVPGIGTLVGGVIGGAVGAISSAFGSGKVDPENANFNGFTKAYNAAKTPQEKHQVAASTRDPYLPLAGLFDLREGQIKGNIPIYKQYGRKGEGQFVKDMFSQINTAVSQGKISKTGSSTDEIMSKVVAPWIDSFGKGKTQDSNTDAINAMIAGVVDDYRTGQTSNLKAIGGDQAFSDVPAYGGGAQSTPYAGGAPARFNPRGNLMGVIHGHA